MTITCNGIPKSGTHALVKAVQMLGEPHTYHGHDSTDKEFPEGKQVYIKRDPRNVMVSWVRYMNGDVVTQGLLIGAFKKFYDDKPIWDLFYSHEHWLMDPLVHVVTFENLISDNGASIQAIADFLGIPFLDDVYSNLPGLTQTWTGRYSDYTEHWTPEVETAWVEANGPEVLEMFGYA